MKWRGLILTGIAVSIAALSLFWFEFNGPQLTATANRKQVASTIGPMKRLSPGHELPVFHFVGELNRKYTLADFNGKVVLLNIWATWCTPCRKEMPALDRLQARMGGADFQVVAISTDREGIPAVQRFYRQLGIKSLEAFADYKIETESELKIPGLPTTMLIDRSGHAIGVTVGPWEWDSEEFVAVVSRVVNVPLAHEN